MSNGDSPTKASPGSSDTQTITDFHHQACRTTNQINHPEIHSIHHRKLQQQKFYRFGKKTQLFDLYK